MRNYNNELILDVVKERKAVFQLISDKCKDGMLIYGAGFIGKWALNYLKEKGAQVKYFVDRNEKKWGTTVDGIEVIGLDDERVKEYPYMLIAVRHFVKEIEDSYKGTDIVALPFDAYYVMDNFHEYEDVRDNYMEDEKSKETYNALLYTALTGDTTACEDVMVKNAYFALPQFSGGTTNEIFVDVGAFVGDSVEQFIWENQAAFRHIYAFEPGENQYATMTKRVTRLREKWCIKEDKITLVKAGLSNKSCKMSSILASDTPMRDVLVEGDGENTIDIYTLDEYLDGKEVTFIKADIEGMEMELLEGARGTIERHKPKLAICVYHYPCDLYCIAKYIREINPEYRFKLRLHTPVWGDFVLYCY